MGNDLFKIGISENNIRDTLREKGRSLARFLLPEKIENWFLDSKDNEEFLKKWTPNEIPTYEEINNNLQNGNYANNMKSYYDDLNLRNKWDTLNADREYRGVRNQNIGQGIVDIGSAAIPVGAGAKAAATGAKVLRPIVGRKIGSMVTQGAVGGAIGGGIHGFGTGLVNEDVNPLTQAGIEAGLGFGIGGLGGYGLGKIGQSIEKRGLYNNPIAQAKYFNDYIEGLSNNAPLGKPSLQSRAMNDFRSNVAGINNYKSEILFDSFNPRHQAQADLINKVNPAPDTYHTWIRNADDIYDFEDTLKPPNFDPDFIGNDFDPSYSWEMAQDAIRNGEIDIYSSYPIDQGVFVTPSSMEAASYAGNGKIYSKRVPLKDVAWIDEHQGQYAPVNDKLVQSTSKVTEKINETNKVLTPYKESALFKKIQARRTSGNEGLYEKLMQMSKGYKKGEYNPLKYKGKSVKIEDITPKEQEYVFHEIDTHISDIEKAKGLATRRLNNIEDKKDYIYRIKYDKSGNGQHKITKKYEVKEEKYD